MTYEALLVLEQIKEENNIQKQTISINTTMLQIYSYARPILVPLCNKIDRYTISFPSPGSTMITLLSSVQAQIVWLSAIETRSYAISTMAEP